MIKPWLCDHDMFETMFEAISIQKFFSSVWTDDELEVTCQKQNYNRHMQIKLSHHNRSDQSLIFFWKKFFWRGLKIFAETLCFKQAKEEKGRLFPFLESWVTEQRYRL